MSTSSKIIELTSLLNPNNSTHIASYTGAFSVNANILNSPIIQYNRRWETTLSCKQQLTNLDRLI